MGTTNPGQSKPKCNGIKKYSTFLQVFRMESHHQIQFNYHLYSHWLESFTYYPSRDVVGVFYSPTLGYIGYLMPVLDSFVNAYVLWLFIFSIFHSNRAFLSIMIILCLHTFISYQIFLSNYNLRTVIWYQVSLHNSYNLYKVIYFHLPPI